MTLRTLLRICQNVNEESRVIVWEFGTKLYSGVPSQIPTTYLFQDVKTFRVSDNALSVEIK